MQIFGGILWRGGVKGQWGNGKRRLAWLFDATSSAHVQASVLTAAIPTPTILTATVLTPAVPTVRVDRRSCRVGLARFVIFGQAG